MRAWRMFTSTASQHGHLTAMCSSVRKTNAPMPTNAAAVMTRSESVGLARRHMPWPLTPVGSYSELWRGLWSRPHPSGRPVRGGVLSPGAPQTRRYQLPVSRSVLALNRTCSTPRGTVTPYCLTSWFTRSNPGHHSGIASAVMTVLHVIPTLTGRPFSPKTVRIDGKKRCRSSGGNASGPSTILRQKPLIPLPNSYLPMSV